MRLAGAVCLALAAAPPLAAQQPAATSSPTATPSPIPTVAQEVSARLAAARAELAALVAGTPAEQTQQDPVLTERRALLEQIVGACERHLSARASLDNSLRHQQEAETARDSWKGFPVKPAPSVTQADELRAAINNGGMQLRAAESEKKLIDNMLEVNLRGLAKSEAATRRLAEEIEKSKTPEERAAAQSRLDIEKLRFRQLAEESVTLKVRRQFAEAERREKTAVLDLAKRQLDSIKDRVELSQKDIDAILKRIDQRKADRETELRRAISRQAQLHPASVEPGGAISSEDEASQAEAETAAIRVEVLRWLIDGVGLEKSLWQRRAALLKAADVALKEEARADIVRILDRGISWASVLNLRIGTTDTALRDVRTRTKSATTPDPALLRMEATLKERQEIYQRGLDAVLMIRRLVENWGLALDDSRLAALLSGRAESLLQRLRNSALTAWNTELYTVQERRVVDGQEVGSVRGITVGKLATVLAILIIGYITMLILARRAEKTVVRRLGTESGRAVQIRRWVFICGMTVLTLSALHYARIPLTAFAFLGGALAIGVGFGTQNLLKNFISGIILLIERPFRLGDILKVDTVLGKVTGIGMRSSILQHPDGIETIIPNSTFLENNVTNWTYSDSRIRCSVKVGVAYGSDTRAVAKALERAAEEHGLVLEKPEPFVLFEDFGESALMFGLYYWISTRQTAPPQVSSDLRFMIERHLGEAGIAIPFPQRDINTRQPLRVEVVTPEPPQGA